MSELDRLGWAVQRTFEIGGAPVAIRTTSEAFGAWLSDALSAHLRDADGPLRYSIVTSERKTGTTREYDILYRGCSAIVRTLHRRTLVESLLTELEAWTFRERNDALFLRMAPLAAHGAVALVPPYVANAITGMGKRAERAGITLPAQLHVAVDPGSGAVIPIPRGLDVDAGTLPAAGAGERPDRYAITEPTTARGLMFFAESGDPVAPVSRGIALYRVASSSFNLHRLGGGGLHTLGGLVAGARCLAVNAVEPAEVLECVARAMREIAEG